MLFSFQFGIMFLLFFFVAIQVKFILAKLNTIDNEDNSKVYEDLFTTIVHNDNNDISYEEINETELNNTELNDTNEEINNSNNEIDIKLTLTQENLIHSLVENNLEERILSNSNVVFETIDTIGNGYIDLGKKYLS